MTLEAQERSESTMSSHGKISSREGVVTNIVVTLLGLSTVATLVGMTGWIVTHKYFSSEVRYVVHCVIERHVTVKKLDGAPRVSAHEQCDALRLLGKSSIDYYSNGWREVFPELIPIGTKFEYDFVFKESRFLITISEPLRAENFRLVPNGIKPSGHE
ncbi:hypothetical protein A3C20_03070 [Candidatus Kaiserbacteria bacterium RIFCSPHIGHO2_02_FULL_55_25]|uniref:Uncharacterized protein n=1 Tax=Candidatus Kaiserbacteria bacterium RIFCSPHIGHO2_02_FULL_55_25 TaxID=1798498 RepID=A0A1F6E6H7_9BACT|nr:MAG: hypothetical protein A3C20_03070 [Candidatus Kaiserbacteria bacterium RIFCSPHIGHO2_02_FULL_55_25]OGG77665.1 MAG: hypothetical protein A3F56_01645 [Candidatus Kaiserbacteria bacterium RIFCSPHIGHO2_12_FULL_55_13]OGG83880.1 MAG: hypothetical protein A3A42_00075 [Candidatus Kaiserbacteria bacterium RIFCSPLOWO2_01_FULL_55_25]